MKRSKYWVVWNSTLSQWQVKKTGNESALKNFALKDDAVSYAVDIARRNEPSQLFIKNQNGQIADERTYGDDPYPPPG